MVWTCDENVKERFPRTMLNWIPERRQPVSRPRKRWMDGVEEGLRARGVSMEEILEERTYEDRNNWRRIVRGQTDRI